jgi:uncharacterized OB-fold protein
MPTHIPDVAPQRSNTELDKFWDYTDQDELRLPRCETCRRWSWVGATQCPRDGSSLAWETAPRRGRVFTYTVVHRDFLPPGSTEVPYVVALIELDGVEGVRILAVIEAATAQEVAIGRGVCLELRRFADHVLPVGRLESKGAEVS